MCCDLCTARPHWPFVSETSCNELHCKLQRRFSDQSSGKCIVLPFFVPYSLATKQLPHLYCLLLGPQSDCSLLGGQGSAQVPPLRIWMEPSHQMHFGSFYFKMFEFDKVNAACLTVEACWRGIWKGKFQMIISFVEGQKLLAFPTAQTLGGHVPLSLIDWHSC